MRRDLPKLSIGEAFDEAFDLYKRNFGVLALSAALLYIPARVVLAAAGLALQSEKVGSGATPSPAEMEQLFGMMGVLFVALFIAYMLTAAASGAITIAASERYLDRPITAGQAWRAMLRSLPRLVGAWVLVGIMIVVAAFAIMFVLSIFIMIFAQAAGATGAGDTWVGVTIVIVFAVVFLIAASAIFIWLGAFITPAIMLERAGAIAAIQRNVQLVRGRVLALTFGMIGLTIVVAVLNNVMALFLNLGMGWFVYSWIHTSDMMQHVIEESFSGVISVLVHPIWMTTLTILYYDQRVRKEGFDFALMLVGLDARKSEAPAERAESLA